MMYKICVSFIGYDWREKKKTYKYRELFIKDRSMVKEKLKFWRGYKLNGYYDRVLVKVSKGKNKKYFVF